MNEQNGVDDDAPGTLLRRGALTALWTAVDAPSDRRPLAPSAEDRTAWDAADTARLLARADAEAERPWPALLLSHWSAYAREGRRDAYEDVLFPRIARTVRAVVAAAADPAPGRVRRAGDALWLLAEQSSWCWPAHDDSFARGLLTPDTGRPFVDLGAGEAAALAAWSDIVLGGLLDRDCPGLRARLRHETRERVVRPFVERRDWHWEGTEGAVHNWAPWIHGNILTAVLADGTGADDDPHADLRARALALCVDGLDRYLAQLPADGAIDEGADYWWHGAARALDALAVLDRSASGRLLRGAEDDAHPLHGIVQTLRFPLRMSLSADWVAGFSDVQPRRSADLPWFVLHRAARLFGDPDAAALAAALRDPDRAIPDGDGIALVGIGRLVHAVLDPDWAPAPRPDIDRLLPRDVLLRSTGVLVSREHAGSAHGLAVVLKGGHNGENHNHQDLGSVTVAVDGVPLLVDPGRAAYTAETFSPRRNSLWYVRSDWHNAPQPRGLAQAEGSAARARLLSHTADDGATSWSADLTAAYPLAPGERWIRSGCLGRERGVLTLRDEWSLHDDDGTALVLVCATPPQRPSPRTLLLPGGDGARGLLLAHGPADVEIEERPLDDAFLRDAWGERLTRVTLRPRPGTGSFELTGRAA